MSSAQLKLTPREQQLETALRRLTREYIFQRTMDGTTAEDCETMECVRAARIALATQSAAAGEIDALRADEHLKVIERFLTDVMTAAGLVTHGRRCKALGDRIADGSAKLRTALYNNTRAKPGAAS